MKSVVYNHREKGNKLMRPCLMHSTEFREGEALKPLDGGVRLHLSQVIQGIQKLLRSLSEDTLFWFPIN